MASHAAYIRRSTFEQENEHQREAIADWLDREGIPASDVEFLSETASGASRNREKFRELLELIEANDVDHVVVWELSRIAREGELAQQFFNACEDHNVHVHVTSGSIREIKPDGTNRFVADILAAVYAEERRTLIRRTKYGQKRALGNDKWVGKPPLGFTTDHNGFLIPNIEFFEAYNDEQANWYRVEAALEDLEADEGSYRGLADDMACGRAALSQLHQDDGRRRWFLGREADDDRVQAALDELSDIEAP